MIYDIINSEELLGRLKGINSWIEQNSSHIGNANMYEIMSCMLARNNIRLLEGDNAFLDAEIEKMISLRQASIDEFTYEVAGSERLFNAVRNGLTGSSREEMEFICKAMSVPFFINNTRKRGFDGDITMGIDAQVSRAIPEFKHDNRGEISFLADSYESASDNVREASYSVVNWVVKNSIPEIEMMTSITPVESGYGK